MNSLLLRKKFDYQGWPVISQDPELGVGLDVASHLDHLLMVASLIEKETGHKWHITSFLRRSPSHSRSVSLDIAPQIDPQDLMQYAVTKGSDPVLYKRAPLIRSLQNVCVRYPQDAKFDCGIFIEPDHLHLQIFHRESINSLCELFKWKQPKPVYSDTIQRMKLPMTDTCYPDY